VKSAVPASALRPSIQSTSFLETSLVFTAASRNLIITFGLIFTASNPLVALH